MKRVVFRNLFYNTIFTGLAIFCIYFLIWSDVGLLKSYSVSRQITFHHKELMVLKREVKDIKMAIEAWESNPFYLEKMAREELGMGYPDEIVYFYQ